MYRFATLDPRNSPDAAEANHRIFTSGPVLGVEITVPSLAERCKLGNIDPQHTDGNTSIAAIEVAMERKPPAEDSILATVRADLDSVGAMAVLKLRQEDQMQQNYVQKGYECVKCGRYFPDCSCVFLTDDAKKRAREIATADKFARGGWPGPKPLPTRDNPWIEETATAGASHELAAIAAAVMDFKVPMADRVATMEKWLLTGEEPKQYREKVEKERLDMINALETEQIKYETRSNGRIAVVESTHRAATSVGYSLAPVVVALNPSFKQGPSEPYKKFTICAFETKFADIKSALAELNELEKGWGGSPTIGGSPQGVSSRLTIDEVVAVVEKHLRNHNE